MTTWSNWSGSLRFTPGSVYEPEDETGLAGFVARAANDKVNIRVAGAGHSSSPLVVTAGHLVSLRKFRSVDADPEKLSAWAGTGLTVKETGAALVERGLALHNTGDVDVQFLSGAISTGTHGTGITMQNLSAMLTGCRMVCADGSVREFTEEKDGREFFNALRVSLGTFGIMTQMRLKLLPSFSLERKEWCAYTDQCLYHLDELVNENRNFDFYWYPRNDFVKLRTLNEPGKNDREPAYAKLVKHQSGEAVDILPRQRQLKFDEMEYALPFEAGPDCFREVRKIVREKFRKTVAWRVLYRTIKKDDFFLSPASGRDTVTISLHQNAGLPFMDYFRTIEPVFRHYGGRPHWGKKHTRKSDDLSGVYPHWEAFLKTRKAMDPEGLFLNEYVGKTLFGIL